MPLSQAQLKKLANGKSVQLKHCDITGCGLDIRRLALDTQKKIHKAWSSGKGIRLALGDEEVEGSGLGSFKKMAKSAAKVAKKGVQESNAVFKDAGMDSIQSQLIQKASAKAGLNPELQSALIARADEAVGEGVFGKKFDKHLKKAGIKKIAYKMGDVAKPLVQKAISDVATAVGTYIPGAAPLANMASKVATDYMDEPDKYQTKDGWKEALKTAVSGQGFAGRSYSGSGFARPSSVGGMLRPRVSQPLALKEVSLSSRTSLPIGHPALMNSPILQAPMAARAF